MYLFMKIEIRITQMFFWLWKQVLNIFLNMCLFQLFQSATRVMAYRHDTWEFVLQV